MIHEVLDWGKSCLFTKGGQGRPLSLGVIGTEYWNERVMQILEEEDCRQREKQMKRSKVGAWLSCSRKPSWQQAGGWQQEMNSGMQLMKVLIVQPQDFGYFSKTDEEILQDSEQRNDSITLDACWNRLYMGAKRSVRRLLQ